MTSPFQCLLMRLEDEHERELTELKCRYDKEKKLFEEQGFRATMSSPAELSLCVSPYTSENKDAHNDEMARHVSIGLADPGALRARRSSRKNTRIRRDATDEDKGSRIPSLNHLGSVDSGSLLEGLPDQVPKLTSEKTRSENSQGTKAMTDSMLVSHVQKHVKSTPAKKGNLVGKMLRKSKSIESEFRVDETTDCVARLVHPACFESTSAAMIVLNAIFIGISTRYDEPLDNPYIELPTKEPFLFDLIDSIFSAWFVIELVMRMRAETLLRFFCFSYNLRWNIFDCLVVGSDLLEIFIRIVWGDNMSVLGNLTIMRLLRLLRVARALRVVRLVTFFSELRLMVLSMMNSGKALFWSLVLLLMIIFVFGIFLMQSVSQFLDEHKDTNNRPELIRWFGNLPTTVFTLFLCVTNGVSWVQVADLLSELHWTNTLVLSFYVFFTSFALLNIITGIFVEVAFSAAQNDKDELIRGELSSENSFIKKLQRIFKKADVYESGAFTIGQFEAIMANDDTRILMKTMGLEVTEARNMFNIMDADGSGEVNIEEFLVGCLRMKGGAKSIDLIALSYESKRLIEMLEGEIARTRKFQYGVEDGLAVIHSSLKRSGEQSNKERREPKLMTQYVGHTVVEDESQVGAGSSASKKQVVLL